MTNRRRPARWPGAGIGAGLFAALVALPLGVAAMLHRVPQLDPMLRSPKFHVFVITIIAACAMIVGVLAVVAAARSNRSAQILLALGCLGVGLLMLGHGLTTPGVWGRPMNMWVARFPVLAIAWFAACLAAAARAHSRVRRPVLAAAACVCAIGAVVATISASPLSLAGSSPLPHEETARYFVLGASAGALLLTGAAYLRRFLLGRDRLQLALAAAAWLAVDSVFSFQFGRMWHLSWWDYHMYLLAGFAAAVYAVGVGAVRARTVHAAMSGVAIVDPLEQIAQGYPEALNALVAAVEAKDRYTHGHSERVAEMAVHMGLNMSLRAHQLRTLAHGAFLHDIGKIGVPDRILNKPSALSDAEWEQIKVHPEAGESIASRAPSLRDALAIIRHHHEHWDGSGYPDGAREDHIPVGARIVAVADVWDALTSERAYRGAWEPADALAHIIAASGAHFDPRCVEALRAVLAERGVAPAEGGTVDEAVRAAADCHAHARISAGEPATA